MSLAKWHCGSHARKIQKKSMFCILNSSEMHVWSCAANTGCTLMGKITFYIEKSFSKQSTNCHFLLIVFYFSSASSLFRLQSVRGFCFCFFKDIFSLLFLCKINIACSCGRVCCKLYQERPLQPLLCVHFLTDVSGVANNLCFAKGLYFSFDNSQAAIQQSGLFLFCSLISHPSSSLSSPNCPQKLMDYKQSQKILWFKL